MDPKRIYEYLTRSRAIVLDAVGALDAEAYEREFEIGAGTFGRVLTHVMISEWYYVQRLLEREVPAYETWPIRDEEPPPLATIRSTWEAQAAHTREALAGVVDWDGTVEFRVTAEGGSTWVVAATRGDIATQLVLHEMHHRAQVLNMLRQLGAEVGEIDFNALMWVRREV